MPLDVPADAEFVIEGHVLPDLREAEGPFGEFTDGYVEVGQNHVLKVSAITRRRDAIYHVILAGGAEDSFARGAADDGSLEEGRAARGHSRHRVSGHIFGCVISLAKADDAQPRAVLQAALAAHSWMKIVVVVDADVDPHDPQDVLWAVHTRHRPDTGIVRIENAAGFPRADVRAVSRQIGLDATAPST